MLGTDIAWRDCTEVCKVYMSVHSITHLLFYLFLKKFYGSSSPAKDVSKAQSVRLIRYSATLVCIAGSCIGSFEIKRLLDNKNNYRQSFIVDNVD